MIRRGEIKRLVLNVRWGEGGGSPKRFGWDDNQEGKT